MRTFTIIWFGQLVSLIGTAMTRFALLIWAYDQTGSATAVALLGFFSYAPYVLASPVAGDWVDRLDRRLVMIAADTGAALMTITLLLLYAAGALQVWHLFAAQALSGVFDSFQFPAYTAATTTLLRREQYTRASGMRSLADAGAQVLAPVLAGLLLALIDIHGVMLIDVATFLIAVGTLAVVRIPQPAPAPDEEPGAGLRRRLARGFRYIGQRPGLLGLLLVFLGINFFAALTYFAILPTLVLARTGGDEVAVGSVMAALGAGGVVGGLVVSVWGGPRRRIHGVLAFAALSFLLGDTLFAVGRQTIVWVAGAFLAAFFVPFILAADRSIWQSKVPPGLQGRVFAVQGMARNISMPLGFLLAGPLADYIFEPAMASGGALAPLFGPIVGVGPGAGMGLMFLGTAAFGALMSLSGYLFRPVRCVEDDLPDHDAAPDPDPVPTAAPPRRPTPHRLILRTRFPLPLGEG